MSIIVRLMKDTDYDAVHRVDILTQIQYLGQKFNEMDQGEQDKHLVSRKFEFQINIDSGFCLVAVENEKIVGCLFAYETLPFHDTLYIRYIGIDPEYQRKSIGLLLYKELIDKAKQSGIKKIWALINTDNPKSIGLHKKVGFKLSDRKQAELEL